MVVLVENPQTRQHTALLTLQIRECVEKAGIGLVDLDAVALSSGPGGYTALRVGASVAKGICYALQKPLIAVDTLWALARASLRSLEQGQGANLVLTPMLDARRQEVWLAAYDLEMRELVKAEPLIFENNSFEIWLKTRVGAEGFVPVLSGNGMEKTRTGNFFSNLIYSKVSDCSAAFLAETAEDKFQKADFQDVAYFEPFYMKPPNITTPGPGLLGGK